MEEVERSWADVGGPAAVVAGERDRVGAGLAIAAASCFAFSLVDAGVKRLSADYPIAEIACGMNLVTLGILVLLGRIRGAPSPGATTLAGLHVARGLLLASSAACAFFAYSRVPLAEAYTLNFTGPLFVTALSGVVLGEPVSARRWLGVLGGFVGVLIALRPGSAVFHPEALGALGNAFLFGIGMLITRRLTVTEHPLVVLIWGATVCALAFGAATALGGFRPPDLPALALLALVGAGNALAMLGLVQALAIAPAAVVAPMQYSQMLWAVALGWCLFGDVSDVWTFVGCAVIAASALGLARE